MNSSSRRQWTKQDHHRDKVVEDYYLEDKDVIECIKGKHFLPMVFLVTMNIQFVI
jgi:hypothetical protein